MPSSSRAIVVGAGIIGLASACYLRARGIPTLVLERGEPGRETSATTGGGVRSQWDDASRIGLSRLSAPVWEGFHDIHGIDLGIRRIGYLFLSRAASQARALQQNVRLQNSMGVASEWLDDAELRRRWPALAARDVLGGAFDARDFYMDAGRATTGFLRSAQRAGAELRCGIQVTGLLSRGDAVVGVMTTEGRLECDVVVNAAGPWAPALARTAGVELHFTARRLPLLMADVDAPTLAGLPWLYDVDQGVHARTEVGGRALMGGFLQEAAVVDPAASATPPDPRWPQRVIESVRASFGVLPGSVRVLRCWTGLHAGPADGRPVIEISRPGLVTVAGFAGSGIMHAPAAGLLAAELVADGSARSMPIEAFSSARFYSGGEAFRAAF
jgi:sarcosine oxidase, subunit beta